MGKIACLRLFNQFQPELAQEAIRWLCPDPTQSQQYPPNMHRVDSRFALLLSDQRSIGQHFLHRLSILGVLGCDFVLNSLSEASTSGAI